MQDENSKLDLHVNDLLLMNVVDIGEEGPIFGVIGQVGAIDLEEESINSPSGNSQVDHAVTSAPAPGESTTEDRPHGSLVNSAIAELEERRAALDIAIQEMKRNVVNTDALQPTNGAAIPAADSQPSGTASLIAKARRIHRFQDQALDQH